MEEEQAEEFPSDSDEEDEEPPESGEDVKWSAEVAGSAPQRRRGPARAIQVPAKYCPDAGKKHTATLTSPEYGLMRVKLAAGADKGAKFKFIIFRPGQEQDEYVVRSNKVLEEKLQAAAEEQPVEANLFVMGAEMGKKQLGILEERGGEIFELSKLCAPDEEEFADIEEYILEGEMDVNSVKGALACMSAVDKAKSGNRLGTNAIVAGIIAKLTILASREDVARERKSPSKPAADTGQDREEENGKEAMQQLVSALALSGSEVNFTLKDAGDFNGIIDSESGKLNENAQSPAGLKILAKACNGSGAGVGEWIQSTVAALADTAPHITEKAVKEVLKLTVKRANVTEKMAALTDPKAENEHLAAVRDEMRMLEEVGKAAGMIEFNGAIGMVDAILSVINVGAVQIKKHEGTIGKIMYKQIALHIEECKRARIYGIPLEKRICDPRPEIVRKAETTRTLIMDMAEIMNEMHEKGSKSPSKEDGGGKEKKGESKEEAEIKSKVRAFLSEHKGKTKEERALLDCPFVATKTGCTRGSGCWWKH